MTTDHLNQPATTVRSAHVRLLHDADVLPRWLHEISSSLSIKSQFLISGNVWDDYVLSPKGGTVVTRRNDALWHLLKLREVSTLIVFDAAQGFRVHDECKPIPANIRRRLGLGGKDTPPTAEKIIETIQKIGKETGNSLALVIEYTSQLLELLGEDRRKLNEFLISIDKISRQTASVRGGKETKLPWTPIFWVVDQPGDLPDWFAVDNPFVRAIKIDLPTQEERFKFARHLAAEGEDTTTEGLPQASAKMEAFALQTEGMTLQAMRQLADMMENDAQEFDAVTDAIRAFRVGSRRNPWRSDLMRSRISNGEELLARRVKGQSTAVRQTLDILIRSMMGLSGAQTSSRHNRPRGVLFFAGPTGVGKTELAKSVTELLFGDETAHFRFDMSEFMSEASLTRLIGAPPGSPGHAAGGELVNAALARPFSVFLFDEIEKAHPRILDLFLQILDEGRLTDARGETAYFSEAMLVFTSNIGIIGDHQETNMGLRVLPSDSHEALTSKIVKGIQDHFRFKLQRPELMGRLGKNVIVFDFINGRSAPKIFDAIVGRVLTATKAEHGIDIDVTESARLRLEELCTSDLFEGGRGIANRIEAHFINPLARLLLTHGGNKRIAITAVQSDKDETRLEFSPDRSS